MHDGFYKMQKNLFILFNAPNKVKKKKNSNNINNNNWRDIVYA